MDQRRMDTADETSLTKWLWQLRNVDTPWLQHDLLTV